MTNERDLAQVIDQLDSLDGELTIYAKSPWTPSSPAVLTTEDDDGNPRAVPDGFDFLEVDVAREVIQAWSVQRDGAQPSSAQKHAAVIHYAKADAYLLPEDE